MQVREIDLTSFNPLRPAPGGAENWYSHRTDVLWIGASQKDAARATAHEADHFILHISTPYGLFLHQLAERQRHNVIQYCHTVGGRPEGRIFYPIYDFAGQWPNVEAAQTLSDGTKVLQNDALQTFVEPWLDGLFLELILEGVFGSTSLIAQESDAIQVFHSIENRLMAMRSDAELFGPTLQLPRKAERVRPFIDSIPESLRVPEILKVITGKACPTSRAHNVAAPIGAANMFEGHAHVVQKGYDTMTSQHIFQADPTLLYAAAALATIQAYGVERYKSETDHRRIYSTMAALADLALFVPVGPVYSRLRSPDATWHDIHPGFRFLHGVSKVGQLDAWLDNLEQDAYRAFQDEISKAIGWPRPDEFVDIGCLLRGEEFARHRKACLIRRDYPCLNLEDTSGNQLVADAMQDLLLYQPPMLFIKAQGHTSLRANSEISLGQIITFFLETLAWKVMTAHRVRVRDCLPQMLDYQAIFANIHNADDLWEIIKESIPFLGENRFVSIYQTETSA